MVAIDVCREGVGVVGHLSSCVHCTHALYEHESHNTHRQRES